MAEGMVFRECFNANSGCDTLSSCVGVAPLSKVSGSSANNNATVATD